MVGKHSEATKLKMRLSAIDRGINSSGNLGHKHSVEAKKKMSENAHWKNKHTWNYISDRTKLVKQEERRNQRGREYRMSILKRDNFKCKIANEDCKGRLEVHHILGWSSYPELRYIINNGITLCHAHHPLKRAEEKRLAPIFQELVSVSN